MGSPSRQDAAPTEKQRFIRWKDLNLNEYNMAKVDRFEDLIAWQKNSAIPLSTQHFLLTIQSVFHDPVQILREPGGQRKGYYFRHFVAVELANTVLKERKELAAGFHNEQMLLLVACLPLPAIDGTNARDDLNTGSQFLLNDGAGDGQGFVAVADGNQNNRNVAHGTSFPLSF
jgi:hypothetical protein